MIIGGEEVYLYSPFDVKRWTEEEIEKEVGALLKKYNPKANAMFEFADDIEILANIMYLYGEMVSRLENEYSIKKLEVDYLEAKEVRDLRKRWSETTSDKAPAMSYFEAEAKVKVKEERQKALDIQSQSRRFKYAYNSFEEKINALKKKMDAIKFEEFGQ